MVAVLHHILRDSGVTVPATLTGTAADIGRKLVTVAELDEIGRLAFQGMKSLNRIQSVVFDCAYRTAENMLVCAPTGAGKTNVAMLCVVQTVKQHIESGVIKKDKFKIVYVAPMKALAAEMADGFGRRLAPLGLTVKELTGDMQLTKKELQETQMIVTTPEKWDVVTRKGGDAAVASLVRLLIIDEVGVVLMCVDVGGCCVFLCGMCLCFCCCFSVDDDEDGAFGPP